MIVELLIRLTTGCGGQLALDSRDSTEKIKSSVTRLKYYLFNI